VERIAGKGGGKGAVLPSFLSPLLLVDFPGKKNKKQKKLFFTKRETQKHARQNTLSLCFFLFSSCGGRVGPSSGEEGAKERARGREEKRKRRKKRETKTRFSFSIFFLFFLK
jgi:hypothetical protein